ncbi:hypothetical protein K440DRAFT_625456 [Wilcoxina mikolae CBS 423.85]|nr:hypothetical protein K440DRAFT_625456 [Wilcoxina mikolae CBS 423.85]
MPELNDLPSEVILEIILTLHHNHYSDDYDDDAAILDLTKHYKLPPVDTRKCPIRNFRLVNRRFSHLAAPYVYRSFGTIYCPVGVHQCRTLFRILEVQPHIANYVKSAAIDWDIDIAPSDPKLYSDAETAMDIQICEREVSKLQVPRGSFTISDRKDVDGIVIPLLLSRLTNLEVLHTYSVSYEEAFLDIWKSRQPFFPSLKQLSWCAFTHSHQIREFRFNYIIPMIMAAPNLQRVSCRGAFAKSFKSQLGFQWPNTTIQQLNGFVSNGWESRITSVNFQTSAIPGEYLQWLFGITKNLASFTYNNYHPAHRFGLGPFRPFPSSELAAALWTIRETLEVLYIDIRHELSQTIGTFSNFPQLRRITIRFGLIMGQDPPENGLVEMLPSNLTYLELLDDREDRDYLEVIYQNIAEVLEAKANGRMHSLVELKIWGEKDIRFLVKLRLLGDKYDGSVKLLSYRRGLSCYNLVM